MPHQIVQVGERRVADVKRELRNDLVRCVSAVSPAAAREAATRGLTLLDVVALVLKHGAVPQSELPSDEQSPTPNA